MANIIPTTSVEFQTLTTEPAWGDASEVDMDILQTTDKKTKTIEEHKENPRYWKLLNFNTRDMRLGNISHKLDDIEYLEDMHGLTHALLNLRDGAFSKQAFLALNRVTSALELSQSRNGFFRQNAQSFHQTGDSTVRETNNKSRGFNPFKAR